MTARTRTRLAWATFALDAALLLGSELFSLLTLSDSELSILAAFPFAVVVQRVSSSVSADRVDRSDFN